MHWYNWCGWLYFAIMFALPLIHVCIHTCICTNILFYAKAWWRSMAWSIAMPQVMSHSGVLSDVLNLMWKYWIHWSSDSYFCYIFFSGGKGVNHPMFCLTYIGGPWLVFWCTNHTHLFMAPIIVNVRFKQVYTNCPPWKCSTGRSPQSAFAILVHCSDHVGAITMRSTAGPWLLYTAGFLLQLPGSEITPSSCHSQ